MIYVNVDSPNLGFPYFNFLGEAQWKKHPVQVHWCCLILVDAYLLLIDEWYVVMMSDLLYERWVMSCWCWCCREWLYSDTVSVELHRSERTHVHFCFIPGLMLFSNLTPQPEVKLQIGRETGRLQSDYWVPILLNFNQRRTLFLQLCNHISTL